MPTAACFCPSCMLDLLHPRTHAPARGMVGIFQIRSKSLEEEKRDRRISWGVDGEEARRRAAGKRRFSEELKRRRHTVAGDTRESR